MVILWIFWGHRKLDYIIGSFQCILGSFLKVYRMGDIFWVAKISSVFFFFWGGEVLEIPDIFVG